MGKLRSQSHHSLPNPEKKLRKAYFSYVRAGQLVSLRCLKGCLVLENVSADGRVTITHALRFGRRATGGGPFLMTVEDLSSRRGGNWHFSCSPITFDIWADVVGFSQAFCLRRQHEVRSFVPLCRSVASDWATVEAGLLPEQREILTELSGLWTGSYGPHG